MDKNIPELNVACLFFGNIWVHFQTSEVFLKSPGKFEKKISNWGNVKTRLRLFFQILWPSHNVLTLQTGKPKLNSTTYFTSWALAFIEDFWLFVELTLAFKSNVYELKNFMDTLEVVKKHWVAKIGVFCLRMLGKSTSYSTGTQPLSSCFWAK